MLSSGTLKAVWHVIRSLEPEYRGLYVLPDRHGRHVLPSSAYDVRMYQLEYNIMLLYHPDQLGGGSVGDKKIKTSHKGSGPDDLVTSWPGRTAGDTEAAPLKQLNCEKIDDITLSLTADSPDELNMTIRVCRKGTVRFRRLYCSNYSSCND